MHNLFLVYFVNLHMFRAYLDPSSGGKTVCIQHLVLIILLDDCLLFWMDSKLWSSDLSKFPDLSEGGLVILRCNPHAKNLAIFRFVADCWKKQKEGFWKMWGVEFNSVLFKPAKVPSDIKTLEGKHFTFTSRDPRDCRLEWKTQ